MQTSEVLIISEVFIFGEIRFALDLWQVTLQDGI